MNKLFPLHVETLGADYSRSYHTYTWEPIAINIYSNGFIPFQYTRTNTQYFYCGQVINSVETDITSKFRSGTELIDTWMPSTYATIIASDYNIYSLSIPSAYPTESATSNYFTLSVNDYLNFRIDGTYSGGGDVMNILFCKGATTLHTDVLHTGKNEIAYKVTEAGSDYNIKLQSVTVVAPTTTLTDALYSCMKCKYEIHNDYLTYYGDALYSAVTEGICTFKFQSLTKLYSEVCLVEADSGSGIFSDMSLIQISSTVDYASIYYKGGFIQKLYRYANVRRSPEPKITVIGEERNGVIVQEKVVTATKYKVKMKINEEMMDALTTAVGATITITDQTGRTFTVSNLEISEPDWYRTNGLLTLSFDDNINVYTQNQTDL